jgi:hypothetical protein
MPRLCLNEDKLVLHELRKQSLLMPTCNNIVHVGVTDKEHNQPIRHGSSQIHNHAAIVTQVPVIKALLIAR